MVISKIVPSTVRRIDVVDFVESKSYKVIHYPGEKYETTKLTIKFPFVKTKIRTYNEYIILCLDTNITYSLEELENWGYVIHDGKVCKPPKIIVYYLDETKDIFCYNSFEEAKSVANEIDKYLPSTVKVC